MVSQILRCASLVRVSTEMQFDRGNGLAAQKEIIESEVKKDGGVLVRHFIEAESGTHDDEESRPVLMEAVEFCASQNIRLYIKTVDRLSRDQFLFQKLLRSGCKFKFVELPNADDFVLTMYCALAQKEAQFISSRTAQGIQQAKKRVRYAADGKLVKWGTQREHLISIRTNLPCKPPHKLSREDSLKGNRKAARIMTEKAKRNWEPLRRYIEPLRKKGLSLRAIAKTLNETGEIWTPGEGKPFSLSSVRNGLKYLGIK